MNNNKKYKTKKIILHNKRNKFVNIRYSSIIKQIIKKVYLLQSTFSLSQDRDLSGLNNKKILLNNLYSIIDKGVKKNILHKNTANKKKAKFSKLLNNIGVIKT